MKTPLLLVLALLPSFVLAQSAVFIPFGQTRSEIQDFLENGQSYILQTDYVSEDTIENRVNDRQLVSYFLNDDILYAVQDQRTYASEEIADQVVKACLEYLDMGEFRVRNVSGMGFDTHYATVEGDRIVELMVQKDGSRKDRLVTITLRSTSRLYGPRMEVEAYASRIVRN